MVYGPGKAKGFTGTGVDLILELFYLLRFDVFERLLHGESPTHKAVEVLARSTLSTSIRLGKVNRTG